MNRFGNKSGNRSGNRPDDENMLRSLPAFLRYRLSLLLFYGLAAGLTFVIQFLAGQNLIYARYTVLLMSFFLAIILFCDGFRFTRRRRALRELSLYAPPRELPSPTDALQADYIRALSELAAAYDGLKSRLNAAHGETLEYYTLWVHQIKTPIAALTLLLSDMESGQAGVMKQELFKIEQYADLALRYIKLEDIAADLVIEHCDIGAVVRECVKKFGVLIVYKRLSVDIDPIDANMLSDRRWLSFVLEQAISNAVKYTPAGSIRVSFENNRLTITDTGIGIRSEDLHRIFSKGYTGQNGRLDSRASGIGLYLAKKAADALNIRMQVRSRVGEGTSFTLILPPPDTALYT